MVAERDRTHRWEGWIDWWTCQRKISPLSVLHVPVKSTVRISCIMEKLTMRPSKVQQGTGRTYSLLNKNRDDHEDVIRSPAGKECESDGNWDLEWLHFGSPYDFPSPGINYHSIGGWGIPELFVAFNITRLSKGCVASKLIFVPYKLTLERPECHEICVDQDD